MRLTHLAELTQVVLQLVVLRQAAEIGCLHPYQVVQVCIPDGDHSEEIQNERGQFDSSKGNFGLAQ